jgi:hypothetical protein
VHNYYIHVDFEAGNLASPRTWSALGALIADLFPIPKLAWYLNSARPPGLRRPNA